MGERIKQIRQQRRLSQEAVAEKLQVSRQAVTKWETGRSMPSTANLLALCELFGVTMEELCPPHQEGQRNKNGMAKPWKWILLVASIICTLLSAVAIAVLAYQPFPDNAIGYADVETNMIVVGTSYWIYGLWTLTILLIVATVFLFLWEKRNHNGDGS